jgi:hypothetical protein
VVGILDGRLDYEPLVGSFIAPHEAAIRYAHQPDPSYALMQHDLRQALSMLSVAAKLSCVDVFNQGVGLACRLGADCHSTVVKLKGRSAD